ncbi:MAG TPA: hypothetical protein VM390_12320 [Acidimicrobiales bacterium]|nr:hypothetical protein [Acidimicrobiales bacterium]
MKPRMALAAILGVAALLGAAGLAWACTNFATLNLSGAAGPAGAEVVATGQHAQPNVPVALRWNSRSAPVVATATPDGAGAYQVPVRVPATASGVQVLLATDRDGNVARAAFEVTGAATSPAAPAAARPAGPDAIRIGSAILALGLMAAVPFAAGLLLWRRPALAEARVRREP